MADFETQMMDAPGQGLQQASRLFQRSVLFYDDTVFPVMSQRAQSETDLDPCKPCWSA
jgi:hypothetical protein